MQLCKLQLASGEVRVGAIDEDRVRLSTWGRFQDLHDLCDVLHAEQPGELVGELIDEDGPCLPLDEVDLLAPVDRQEVWAAGVTYRRTRRKNRIGGDGPALRPGLFSPAAGAVLQGPAYRVSGTGDRVRIRRDSKGTSRA